MDTWRIEGMKEKKSNERKTNKKTKRYKNIRKLFLNEDPKEEKIKKSCNQMIDLKKGQRKNEVLTE